MMDKKLIYVDALEEILKDFESRYKKRFFYLSAKTVATVRQIVYAMKTVDAVPVVHGHWIEHLHFYECSRCEFDVCDIEDYNYCLGCGAKMDGERRCEE